MLEVKGAYITEGLPFGEMKLITELLEFDGEPMLLHYADESNIDWIAYWVDFDKDAKRWMYGKVKKEELYHYLVGSKSLKDLFGNISSDYVFLLDFNIEDKCISTCMINSYSIPGKYFAGSNSYYTDGINEDYQVYLKDNVYIDRLRHESFRLIAEPTDQSHGRTVSAKDGALILNATVKSMEGYIDVTGMKMLIQKPITKTKLNKKINNYKKELTPRMTNNLFHSFEVWLTMDVITMQAEDEEEIKWRNELIENYKNDVLNVDISDPTDATIIAEKYTEDERRLIFEPLWKMYDNENISIKITDYKETFTRDLQKKPLSSTFKEIVTPRQTKEQIAVENENELELFQFVAKLNKNQDLSTIRIKDLRANTLLGDKVNEVDYPIHRPFENRGDTFFLKKDIKGVLALNRDGSNRIYHPDLEIDVTGEDFKVLEETYRDRVADLIRRYLLETDETRKSTDPLFIEIAKYF